MLSRCAGESHHPAPTNLLFGKRSNVLYTVYSYIVHKEGVFLLVSGENLSFRETLCHIYSQVSVELSFIQCHISFKGGLFGILIRYCHPPTVP